MAGWASAASDEASAPLIWFNCQSLPSYGLMRVRKAYPRQSIQASRAMIEPGGKFHRAVQEGGSWWRRVELANAYRNGDTSERTAIMEQ